MKRTALALIALLVVVVVAPAAAAEGSGMTVARELDLAAQHLAATAQLQAKDGGLSPQAAETALGFAALVRDFRFDLESRFASTLQAETEWAQVADGFVATRDLLHDSDAQGLRNEVFRVNNLMNRLDRAFGGTGFWSGPRGWSG